MAISKSFFGLRRKSTKTHTYQIYRGQQVTKDRVSEVRNPKTPKQTAQRLIFATVTQATKFLAGIIDHSFEGKTFGGVSKNYFQKLNMNYLRKLAAIDFAEAPAAVDANVFMSTRGISALIPNKYIISDGSLAPSTLKVARNTSGEGTNLIIPTATARVYNDVLASGERYVTYGDLLKAVFGIQSADEQITLVSIIRTSEGYRYAFNGEPTMPGWMIPYTAMSARRLVLKSDIDLSEQIIYTDTTGAVLDSGEERLRDAVESAFGDTKTDTAFRRAIVQNLEFIFSDPETQGVFDVITSQVNQIALDDFFEDEDGNGHAYAAGIIRSRRNGGNWLRSRSVMVLAKPSTSLLTNFGLDWNSAQQAWFETETIADNPEFLDEGGDGGQIGENFTTGA